MCLFYGHDKGFRPGVVASWKKGGDLSFFSFSLPIFRDGILYLISPSVSYNFGLPFFSLIYFSSPRHILFVCLPLRHLFIIEVSFYIFSPIFF